MYKIHRYARFAADGTGVHYGALCWEGSAQIPVPPPDAAYPDAYIVPLDAKVDDWHRLEAEAAVHGHLQHARHDGGTPHPRHAHVRLGGALAWTQPAHPDVAIRAQQTQEWTHERLVAHLAGPGR